MIGVRNFPKVVEECSNAQHQPALSKTKTKKHKIQQLPIRLRKATLIKSTCVACTHTESRAAFFDIFNCSKKASAQASAVYLQEHCSGGFVLQDANINGNLSKLDCKDSVWKNRFLRDDWTKCSFLVWTTSRVCGSLSLQCFAFKWCFWIARTSCSHCSNLAKYRWYNSAWHALLHPKFCMEWKAHHHGCDRRVCNFLIQKNQAPDC